MLISPSAAVVAATLATNQILSWMVYNMTWWNSHPYGNITPFGGATQAEVKTESCTFRLLKRFRHYPIHAFIMWGLGCQWDPELPFIRVICLVACYVLMFSAVFRFGSSDLQHYFIVDRLLAVAACLLSHISPVFAYVSLLVSCLLQYTISSWTLAPPYSNYLSFEYVRISLSNAIGVTVVKHIFEAASSATIGGEVFIFSFLLGGANYYFHQGTGKIRLGNHPLEWISKNRGECIMINSYLRGWFPGVSKKVILKAASFLKTQRLMLGVGAIVAETGGFLTLLLSLLGLGYCKTLFSGFYLLVGGFHLAVFAMAGILVWGNVVINCSVAYLLATDPTIADFTGLSTGVFLTAMIGIILTDLYIVGLYKAVELLEGTSKKIAMLLFDASFLLMCWWDSPYMRLYSYSVETEENGVVKKYQFPVTKFSPYDTMITDIHTRMSYLHMHTGFDRQRTADLETAHPGVWGLLLIRQEAMQMYEIMDSKGDAHKQQLSQLSSKVDEDQHWDLRDGNDNTHPAFPLLQFFVGVNSSIRNPTWGRWYKRLMAWPHFPGEDWVPDASPLCPKLPDFPFHAPVRRVIINRIKTFYEGTDIIVLENSCVGVIHISELTGESRGPSVQLTESEFVDGVEVHRVGR
eukprot:TRINITY_DN13876_c0_g1_i1.p1 TRINITY_DN13876_c0_g1~~TRINITY_DN13876_c0_g1_i1.p1  ORF type:complete len:653 (+),score=52.24 TRINITY_DN13876_c0_g1_i1:59-1960(+)